MASYIEYNHCLTLWDYIIKRPELKQYVRDRLIFHVANERKTSVRAGSRLKRIGVQPGVHDYIFLVPRGTFHGLTIEMKSPNNTKVTKDQKVFLAGARREGYRSEVCFSCDAAIEVVSDYFGLLKPL